MKHSVKSFHGVNIFDMLHKLVPEVSTDALCGSLLVLRCNL